jgi:metal-sulfur cluster biosynthetic enzyme
MTRKRSELHREIASALDEIKDPCSVAGGTPMGLTEMGLIGHVAVGDDGAVAVHLRLTSPFCHMIPFMQSETVKRVGALEGVSAVTVHGDEGLEWTPEMIDPAAQARRLHTLQERFRDGADAGRRRRETTG